MGPKTSEQDPFQRWELRSETWDPHQRWDPGSKTRDTRGGTRTFIIIKSRNPERSFQITQNKHCLINLLHAVFPKKDLLFGFYDFEMGSFSWKRQVIFFFFLVFLFSIFFRPQQHIWRSYRWLCVSFLVVKLNSLTIFIHRWMNEILWIMVSCIVLPLQLQTQKQSNHES